MANDDGAHQELDDSVRVWRAKRDIDAACADLAARPLDEATADQMRAALNHPDLANARESWERMLTGRTTPRLRLVTGEGETA